MLFIELSEDGECFVVGPGPFDICYFYFHYFSRTFFILRTHAQSDDVSNGVEEG